MATKSPYIEVINAGANLIASVSIVLEDLGWPNRGPPA